ncbi:DUF2147 domain-containing protein [Burkholderiaceae bacterium DAT-1]|nr:DUF2147 domain-containing protein [Burkholderiaceae bacterium DAT-1]
MKRFVLAATAVMMTGLVMAADMASPIGTWKTIDDSTGKPRAIVELWQDKGELRGKIVKRFPQPGDNASGLCENCTGDLKDKPIDGMTFVWGLKQEGSEWAGGKILDPANGKVYSAKMELTENGSRLKVRGFLGFALLGRTQVWHRE